MIINITYDSSVTASNFTGGSTEETAFKGAVTYAVNELESLFTNTCTINIVVGWGEFDAQPIGSGLISASISNKQYYSYSQITAALVLNAGLSGDAAQLEAAATLLQNNPPTGQYQIPDAEAKALGLPLTTPPQLGSSIDGFVGFNSSKVWSFTPYVGSLPPTGQSLIGAAEHEITEIMGRISLVGEGPSAKPTIMDLFRYSAPNTRDLTSGPKGSTAYFSYDNGITQLGNWNNYLSGGDLGDWYSNNGGPVYRDAFGGSGVRLSTTDVTLMNVLGWDTAFPSYDVPNGVIDYVSSGHPSFGMNVLSGGYLEVGSGGTAFGVIVSAGGSAKVDNGGVASAIVVRGGGTETVHGTDVIASIDGGYQYISHGGQATGTTVGSGGYEYVESGGTTNNTVVKDGGAEYVESGGKAISTIVENGGVENVESGGKAISTVVENGGVDYIFSHGSASNTTVNDGGVELVFNGGKAISTVVENGGIQGVFGAASKTTLSGGEQDVLSGGTASDTIVKNGGVEYVEDGGKAIGTVIHNGGQEIVESGGTANGATISGGTLEFKNGAIAGSNVITFVGGTLKLDDSFDFSGLIAGFAKPDQIDLKDISFISGKTSETFILLGTGVDIGTLTVSDGTHTADIAFLGHYVTANFNLASDGHGGTLVTEQALPTPVHHGFFLL